GGGGGIGRAIATAVVGRGQPVVLIGRERSRLDEARASLAGPGQVVVAPADIQDEPAMRAIVDDAAARFGGIDALVACAAAHGPEGPLDELPLDAVASTFMVNLVGTAVSCRAVLPHLRRSGRGNLVLYTSGAGHVIPRRDVRSIAYQISKFGIDGLVNGLAVQLRGSGINVNGIRPGRTLSGANLGRGLSDLRAPEQSVAATLFLADLEPSELSGFVLEAADFERGFRPTRGDHTL
ncbi:MAG TPA: SDR family oxidoreductase, partial [Candidatus Limnocylindrales bacterium]|nr:SDR family oxidoreductase [Candidatus Limnocylindrales bacterium]